jgi:hypothetical protein
MRMAREREDARVALDICAGGIRSCIRWPVSFGCASFPQLAARAAFGARRVIAVGFPTAQRTERIWRAALSHIRAEHARG